MPSFGFKRGSFIRASPLAASVRSNRKKKLWSCARVGSATVPTRIGGHGGPPYGPKHLRIHTRAVEYANSSSFDSSSSSCSSSCSMLLNCFRFRGRGRVRRRGRIKCPVSGLNGVVSYERPPLAAGVQSNFRRNLMSCEVSGVRELRRYILTPEH